MMNEGDAMNQPLNENDVLRSLLSSWNLECLLQRFIDEGINADVLLMLKPHHIPLLLRDFRLGVQIRFEYHLERWRHKIHNPLPSQSAGFAAYCCSHDENKVLKPTAVKAVQDVAVQWPHSELQMGDPFPTRSTLASTSSPVPSSHDSTYEPRPPPKLTPVAAPPALKLAAGQAPRSSLTAPSTPAVSTPAASTPAASTPLNQRSQKNHVFSGDDHRSPHVSVALILNASQPRGQQLLDYYREHQCLTSTHRLQLINMIATYFDDRDYHLSLQTSYNMEREILKLFPGERLESYRTEKRGKIYVKFCNMKRYRANREKPSKLRRCDSLDDGAAAAVDACGGDLARAAAEDFTVGFDMWGEQLVASNDVYVKTENTNDGDHM